MEEYIEIPQFGGIFPSGDINFSEMVQMDGRSMQNMCQVSRESREFCSKDNEEFWLAKYNYFAKGLGIPMDWKPKWIHLYQKVRKHPGKYLIMAVIEDKPSILVIMQKCNTEISNRMVENLMHRIQPRVLNYLLSNIYTGKAIRKRFKRWLVDARDQWGMDFSLDFVKILYKYGIILDVHFIINNREAIHFYLQEGIVDPSTLQQITVEEFRDFKKYGVTWRNVFPDGIEDLFGWCNYEFINELFKDGMTLDDLRNAPPFDSGPYLTGILGQMLYANPEVDKVCANRILSKLRKLGLTEGELNEAYANVHKMRQKDAEEEAEAAAEAVAEADEAAGLQAAQALAEEEEVGLEESEEEGEVQGEEEYDDDEEEEEVGLQSVQDLAVEFGLDEASLQAAQERAMELGIELDEGHLQALRELSEEMGISLHDFLVRDDSD